MKTALVFPPQWFPSQPYLALPTLKGYLEKMGHEADQFDFNLETYDTFLTKNYLAQCVEKSDNASMLRPTHRKRTR